MPHKVTFFKFHFTCENIWFPQGKLNKTTHIHTNKPINTHTKHYLAMQLKLRDSPICLMWFTTGVSKDQEKAKP